VDPDAILYADRLRGHLQWHIGQFLAKEAHWHIVHFSVAAMSWQNGCMTQQEIQESVMLCLFCRLFGDQSWSNEFNIWRCLKECILPELRQIHPGHHVWSLGGRLCTSRRKIGSIVVLPSSKLRLNMLNIIQPSKLVVHLQWPSFDFVLLFIGVEMVNDVAPSRVPMQVFSKAALGSYLSQHQRCERSLPFWSWGEDRRLVGSLVEWKLAQHLVSCLIHIYSSHLAPDFFRVRRSSWAIHFLQRYMAGCLEMLGVTWPNWPKPVLAAGWPLDLPIIGPLTRDMSYLCQNSTPSLGHYWPNVSVWGENSAWLHEFPARWTMLGSGLRKQGSRRIPFASWLSMLHSTKTFQTLCVECVWHVLTKCLQVKKPDP